MARVHPQGSPVPLSQPLAFENGPGTGLSCGQVVSVGLMIGSIRNQVFDSPHVPVCATMLTSSCGRHGYALPFWSTCVVLPATAFARPLTPSQPPYRLSKLWFS